MAFKSGVTPSSGCCSSFTSTFPQVRCADRALAFMLHVHSTEVQRRPAPYYVLDTKEHLGAHPRCARPFSGGSVREKIALAEAEEGRIYRQDSGSPVEKSGRHPFPEPVLRIGRQATPARRICDDLREGGTRRHQPQNRRAG